MARLAHEVSRHLVKSFESKALKKRSFAVRFADNLTSLFGSVLFLLANATVFTGWILINTGKIPSISPFDPYPFSMLTTAVSLEAIILTVIVLMSQNRQSLISSLREEMDLQVNLMTEREITKVLQLLTKYLKDKGIKIEDKELEDMLEEIDASYIERKLEAQHTNKPSNVVIDVAEPKKKAEEKNEKTLS